MQTFDKYSDKIDKKEAKNSQIQEQTAGVCLHNCKAKKQ